MSTPNVKIQFFCRLCCNESANAYVPIRPLGRLEFHPADAFFCRRERLRQIHPAGGGGRRLVLQRGGGGRGTSGSAPARASLSCTGSCGSPAAPRPRAGFIFLAGGFFNIATEIEKRTPNWDPPRRSYRPIASARSTSSTTANHFSRWCSSGECWHPPGSLSI